MKARDDESSPIREEISLPSLETPSSSEILSNARSELSLRGDSEKTVLVRLAAAEILLGLLVKDIPFDDFMREILVAFLGAISSEAGSIIETDSDRKALFFRATAGRSSDRLSSVVIPWGVGIVGSVAETRRPALIQDVAEDSRHLRSVGVSVGFECRNLMAAPIVVRGQTFCVVELLNRSGRPAFDEEDLRLFTQISEMAAKVIEARLMINGARMRAAA